jgi:hypothetical protein
MIADAWTLSLLVAAHGWCPMTTALLDSFMADVIRASARPHHPRCRCPRA